MRQQRHQRGMVRLTRRITRLENEVNQAMAVMDADTGKLLNYRQLMRNTKYREAWSLSSANEFGRLANGIGGRIKNPTNTIEFIFQHDVPTERMKDVTYGQFVCTVRPEKAEPNRTRFTVGGDRINYPGAVATPTAEMLVAKMLFNSVISTKDARFMTMDISNFYLMTPLHRPKFIRIKLCNIPDEVINEYKLPAIFHLPSPMTSQAPPIRGAIWRATMRWRVFMCGVKTVRFCRALRLLFPFGKICRAGAGRHALQNGRACLS